MKVKILLALILKLAHLIMKLRVMVEMTLLLHNLIGEQFILGLICSALQVRKKLIFPKNDPATGKLKPMDLYNLFLTDELLDLIVRETNKYAKQVIDRAQLTHR